MYINDHHNISADCNCGQGIDDIQHFLCHCVLYTDMRHVLDNAVLSIWEAADIKRQFGHQYNTSTGSI